MSPPLVSIVIPTYNHASYLRLALESVVGQSYADWECIVVNNFSTDNTEQVVASFNDPRIQLVDFANDGVIAASRNRGIELATGEWVAFLDADDAWDPQKLEKCLAAGGESDVVSHPEQFVRNGVVEEQTAVATPEEVKYRNLLFGRNCLSPSAILVRRNLLVALGGFCTDRDLITAEDYDLWLRLARTEPRFAFVDECLAIYRRHDGQNTNRIVKHRDASLAVLRRHLAHLPNPSFNDRRRGRQACALTFYIAGCSFQEQGQYREMLQQWGQALRVYPFHWKVLFLPLVPVAKARLLALWRNFKKKPSGRP